MISYTICLSLSDLFHLTYPCCCKRQNFILFYGWVIFHFIYIHHIFFIHHQLMDTGCLHVSAIVNNAVNVNMNIRVHVSFQISVFVFLDTYHVVKLLGCMLVLFLVFWETSILFSTVAAQIYIPTNSVWVFSFLFFFLL